jgi:hypothetical protein
MCPPPRLAETSAMRRRRPSIAESACVQWSSVSSVFYAGF